MHFLLLYNEDGMILYSGEEGDILLLPPHPRQEEEEWVRRGNRNMIKEPALSSSSAIFPLPLFSAFLGRSHEFFCGMGWLPPPAMTSVPLILTKPWFSLLQNEDNNSTYLLRSPGKIMQVQFLAQGLAQRGGLNNVKCTFLHQSCLIWEILRLTKYFRTYNMLKQRVSKLIYKLKVKFRAEIQALSSPYLSLITKQHFWAGLTQWCAEATSRLIRAHCEISRILQASC